MALETQTISSAEIKPIFAFDTDAQALGTAHEAADDYITLPILSYSLPYNSATLEMAPNRVGVYGQLESQGRHRQDLNTFTFDCSFLATTTAIRANCLWAFGDAATPMALTPAIGIGNGTAGDMQMKHGATSNNHTTAIFVNGGTDAAAEDLIVKGAMVQSLTLKMDIGANAGQMTIDTSFFTPYAPHEAADTTASDSTDTGTPKSIFELNTNSQAGCLQLGGQELQPTSWEITISRTLERVGSQDYSSYLPFAIAQTGAWEVTGTLNVKADDNTYDLITQLKGDSSGINLSIDGADGFGIDLPDVMVDTASLDNGGSHLTHAIPFRAFAADGSSNIISIAI
tara:strand:+ start:4059 stop:5084 length:1026 start_codon:yes stop_codon:yes gene_type:complete